MTGFLQNLHTHTTYCDGKLSAEEMIQAAIQKGGNSIGFSEHSYVAFDEEYSMKLCDTQRYISEINSLKLKYKSQVAVYLGIEVDYFTDVRDVPEGFDYIIGTVHHIEKDGKHLTIDATFENLEKIRDEYFGEDYYTLAEKYYETIAKLPDKFNIDIIGHFDLIAKQNSQGRLFDEKHPRYQAAATNAMEQILKKCRIFEVNTGGMYRRGVGTPYPSKYLLTELQKRGGEVLLSSDSHDADSLYFKFDEMRELVKSCGFTSIKRLTKDGFTDEEL